MKRWIVRWMSWLCLLTTVGCAPVEGDGEGSEGQPLSASPASCDGWRLFLAGEGLARVEHPGGMATVSLLEGAFEDVAAADDDQLYASLGGGIWRARRGEAAEASMLVAAGTFSGSSALVYDHQLGRLLLSADLGIFALEPDLESPSLSVVHLAWPPGGGFDALALASGGGLFASSWDGEESTVAYFAPPVGAALQPERVFSSHRWDAIRDLAYGIDGSLYLTDGGPTVYVVDNPEIQSGAIEATKTITFEGAALSGILIAPDGVGYLVDEASGLVIAVEDLSEAYPWAPAAWTIPHRGASRLALLPPCEALK